MAMKCCAKLETAKERCPIVFQSHPSTFKVTRDKTSPILTPIGRFRTIGRSQLSNPSNLPCCTWIIYARMVHRDLTWGLYECICQHNRTHNTFFVMICHSISPSATLRTRFKRQSLFGYRCVLNNSSNQTIIPINYNYHLKSCVTVRPPPMQVSLSITIYGTKHKLRSPWVLTFEFAKQNGMMFPQRPNNAHRLAVAS